MILLYVLTVHYQGKLYSLQDCLTNTSTSLDYATPGIVLNIQANHEIQQGDKR
jgi:hypothetical protein